MKLRTRLTSFLNRRLTVSRFARPRAASRGLGEKIDPMTIRRPGKEVHRRILQGAEGSGNFLYYCKRYGAKNNKRAFKNVLEFARQSSDKNIRHCWKMITESIADDRELGREAGNSAELREKALFGETVHWMGLFAMLENVGLLTTELLNK